MNSIHQENETILARLSGFLCADARAITPEALAEMTALGLTESEAYMHLLAAWLELPAPLWRRYLPRMLHRLDPAAYMADPCLQAIRDAAGTEGPIALGEDGYAPCELFVADDFVTDSEGRVYPQLGWFREGFRFPALTENGRVWMTVTPNEINTIRPCAQAVHGKVAAYGLGLGYFAFHALLNPRVTSVTVVERSANVIDLFRRRLLPRFPRRECLRIVQADAFDYAARTAPRESYDCVFTDLWHDAGDGLPLYRRMKALEGPGPRYFYWIEKTLRAYLPQAEA
ncbi:MAG: hypothetical protein ACI4OY_03125 [Aristaeellaceae bacterium]